MTELLRARLAGSPAGSRTIRFEMELQGIGSALLAGVIGPYQISFTASLEKNTG